MADKQVSVTLRARVDQFVAGMKQASAASSQTAQKVQSDWSRMGSQMSSAGRTLSLGVTAPLAAVGAVAVKSASEFNASFTRMTTLAGVTAKEIGGLQASVKGLAGQTGRAPNELAEALYFLRSSGLDGAAAMEALEMSAQAAAAGMGSTVGVADAVSSAMNAYATSGLSAAEATDVLVATARAGKAEPEELASSLGRVLPVAAELGVTFQDVGGAIASFSQTGNDASGSVTLLSNVLLKMLKPSQQGAEALANVGLSVEKIRESISQVGLLGTLDMLKERLGDSGMVKFFEDQQAVVGVLSLLGQNAENVAATFDEVANSQGSLGDAFQSWLDGPGAGISKAWAEIQVAAIDAGEKILPVVADIVGVLGDMAGAFSELPGPVQTAVLALGGLAALAGPLLIGAGMIVRSLDSITAAQLRLNAARGVGGGLGFIGPIGPAGQGASIGGAGLLAGLGAQQWFGGQQQQTVRQRLQERNGGDGWFAEAIDGWLGRNPSGSAAPGLGRQQLSRDFFMSPPPMQAATQIPSSISSSGSWQQMMGRRTSALGALGGGAAGGNLAAANAQAEEMVATLGQMARAASEYGRVVASTDWGTAAFVGAQTAMSAFNDEFFGLTNMAMATEAAYDNLNQSITDNGFTFDLATEKGRANQAALQDLAGTLEGQFVSAYDNANGSLDTFMASADAIGMGVLATLQSELGLSAEQATELAEKLGLTAGDYQARFELAGAEEARVRLDLLSGAIGLLQEDVQREVAMRIATGDFQGALDLVQANITETPTDHNTTFTAQDNASRVAMVVKGAVQSVPTSWVTTFTSINRVVRYNVEAPGGSRNSGGDNNIATADGGYFASTSYRMIGEAGPEVVLPLSRPGRMMDLISDPRVSGPLFAALGQMTPGSFSSASASSSGTPGTTVVWNQNAPVYGVDDLKRTLNDAFRERDARARAGVR